MFLNNGLVCWRTNGRNQPWDERSWEAEEWWVEKWGGLVGEECGVRLGTRWWRGVRGEDAVS